MMGYFGSPEYDTVYAVLNRLTFFYFPNFPYYLAFTIFSLTFLRFKIVSDLLQARPAFFLA